MEQQAIYLVMERGHSYVVLGTGKPGQFNNRSKKITLDRSVEIPINHESPQSFFNSKTARELYSEHLEPETSTNPQPVRKIQKSALVYQFVSAIDSQ